MERTKDEIKLSGVKIVNIDKALDKFQSQASDLLGFSLQCRDLNDYLKSLHGKVEKRFKELECREAELQKRSFEIGERGKVKADGFRREIEVKEEELSGLRRLVEEFAVKQRLKASEFDEMVEALRKTQVEIDLKGGELAKMETDLERHRAETGRAETRRRELDEEIVRKTRDLTLVQEKVAECGNLLETKSLELTKTQGELDSRVGQLAKMEGDLQRHRVAVSAEMDRAETRMLELDKEIERKTRDLSVVQEKVVECGELLETRSLELTKIQGELDLKVEQLGHVKVEFESHRSELAAEMEHLDRVQTRNRDLEADIERKKKGLAQVLDRTKECGKQVKSVEEELASQRKVLETRSSKLVSKEKELQVLSRDIDLRQEMVNSLKTEMEETCHKMASKAKDLKDIERLINERSGHCKSIKLLIEEHTEELACKEKRHGEITEAIHKLSLELALKENTFRECHQNLGIKEEELKSLETILTERNKQVEEGEKKVQDLNNSSEELIRQLKVGKEQVRSINEAIKESTGELEAKRKHHDQVQSSITDLTVELKLKECHLRSVKKKIQESLKDLRSTEEQQVRLKASLLEHEKGLELREKELIAREEMINEKDQKLQITKQELAKWVEDYEVKAKQLSSFCQDQHVALTPGDIHKPTGNSRKRGRLDDKSLSQSRDESLDVAIKSLDHVLTSCTTVQENTYNFENQRSSDKFKIDQVWAIYSDSDKGMPRKYGQIKRIDTSPEFKLHVAPLVMYRPPPNPMTHPVCCGLFKLKIGKAEVLVPSSLSHKVKAVKSSINKFEVYPGKGEIWALYKNWKVTDSADETEQEELEIVEVVETNEQSIQAMLLTAKMFNKLLYGRCLESVAGIVDIPKTEMNRFSHQIPAFRCERKATRSGDCEWWELDPKAVLDLNSKKP